MRSAEERPPMNLLEEMFTEILVRLPVNSLVRSSCVCKSWRNLIGDPYFVEKHLEKNKNNNPMIFFRHQLKEETEDLLFTFPKYEDDDGSLPSSCRRGKPLPDMKAIGSCNGIVCLAEDPGKEVRLCNSCTGEHRQLPHHNLSDEFFCFLIKIGFGFDASTKDYKVVVIGVGQIDVEKQAKVYKLSTDCWNEVISTQIFRPLRKLCEPMGVVDDSLAIICPNPSNAKGFYVW